MRCSKIMNKMNSYTKYNAVSRTEPRLRFTLMDALVRISVHVCIEMLLVKEHSKYRSQTY